MITVTNCYQIPDYETLVEIKVNHSSPEWLQKQVNENIPVKLKKIYFTTSKSVISYEKA